MLCARVCVCLERDERDLNQSEQKERTTKSAAVAEAKRRAIHFGPRDVFIGRLVPQQERNGPVIFIIKVATAKRKSHS